MKKITSVALIGAGAIGGYVIWGLSELPGINFCVLAEGERKERLKGGFEINGQHYSPAIRTPEETHGIDLIIVSVKYQALPEAVDMVRRAADDHTLIVSVMNGVTSEQALASVTSDDQVVPAFIRLTSERLGNNIQFYPPSADMGIIYGEPGGNNNTERMQALEAFFAGTPLVTNADAHITDAMWGKFALNISENLSQAVLDTGIGAYAVSKHADWLRHALWSEVKAVADAKGIHIPPFSPPRPLDDPAVPATALYSTLQDLRAGRKTEIDMFSGDLIKMGRELSVPTPYNEMIYHIIKTFEERNDGKFRF